MQVNDFIQYVKKCKMSTSLTGYTEIRVSKLSSLIKKIYSTHTCPTCHRNDLEKELIVKFKKELTLTIFQAEMLFMVMVENKLPRDYAKYHECIAGKEFIHNIDSLEVTERF